MIHIEISRLRPTSDLLERAERESHLLFERHQAGEFHEQRIPFRSEIWMRFKPSALKAFYGKCAYCESPIASTSNIELDHFRPKTQASALNGEAAVDYYFWLAYEWRNIYPACQACNRSKRTYFPVLDQRDLPGTRWKDLKEVALLLDPCLDNPEDFLLFSPEGTVSPRELSAEAAGRYAPFHPGEITIKLLDLNRLPLVKQRRELAEQLQTYLEFEKDKKGRLISKRVKASLYNAVADDAPYAALAREILREYPGVIEETLATEPAHPRSPAKAAREIARVLEEIPPTEPARPRSTAKASQETVPQVPTYEPVSIVKLSIQNFRTIEDLKLSFPKTWKVFLGENSTGKSTILQAVAWALMGKDFVARRHANGRKWLTVKNGRRRKEGHIELKLDRGDPIRIDFDQSSIRFTSGGATVPTFFRAYGTTRLPASRNRRSTPPVQEVQNLFDPHFPLTNALKWLATLQDYERKPAILAIRDMLLLDPATTVDFRRGRFSLPLHGERFTTDQLSAGYQDVFNLVADIISGFPFRFSDMQEAFGIVLLDELGAHLHPRWKMKIVASLKQCFPKIQFLVSTHDPLCLRGLDKEEVVVMMRDSEGVSARTDFDRSPRYMRVDQLLTSSFFGLQSTVDPELDADFREYYRLLLKDPLTPKEEKQRDELRVKLGAVSAHGITRRDELLCRILDEYLAKAWRDPQSASQGPSEETKRRVWERWKQLQEGAT